MKLRIYTDTSVIGGCLDEEFAEASRRLFDKFKVGEAIIVVRLNDAGIEACASRGAGCT